MGLSRTDSEINGDFSRKSQIFPTPCALRPRWRGSPWNWVSVLGSKNRMMALPGREGSLTIIFSRVDTMHQHDGRTDTGRQQRPRLRIASRCKNCTVLHWVASAVSFFTFGNEECCAVLTVRLLVCLWVDLDLTFRDSLRDSKWLNHDRCPDHGSGKPRDCAKILARSGVFPNH